VRDEIAFDGRSDHEVRQASDRAIASRFGFTRRR